MFWPLRRVSDFLLPLSPDELSPERASKLFNSYLKKNLNSSNNNDSNNILELFSTKSYASLQREAASNDALIMVYLHSPHHRSADDVCRRLLCSPSMVRFLTENKGRVLSLGSSISTAQGASLSYSLTTSSFPVLALLQPVKSSSGTSSSTISSNSNNSSSNNNNNNNNNAGGASVAPGPVKLIFKAEGPALMKLTAMQLTTLVTATFQKHERTVLEDASRRYEREQEVELRRQQDEEYQETLRQDQERELQRTEERLEAEREEELKIEEEIRKVTEEANRLDRARSLVRDEPPKGTPGSTRIRFRLPNGKQLDRRFEGDETIESLKAYLILHFVSEKGDDCVKRVALSTTFPKRTYGGDGKENEDDLKTLQECDLCPQAVLMVQDLDA
jgi:FAS-associated factor 2